MTKINRLYQIYDKIRSKYPPNRSLSPTCPRWDVMHLCLTTGVVDLHTPSWRAQERAERRHTSKIMCTVNAGRVICWYRNHLFWITNHNKYFRDSFFGVVALHIPPSGATPLPWASGNSVAIQCAWNLDPSVHWNATGEIVDSQCVSSVLPVVFQCVPIMQLNTGSPLGHHWVLASASVVPVASQCTCGSSGLPVWSVQWYPSVLTESGLEVIRSGNFPACSPFCIQLVW